MRKEIVITEDEMLNSGISDLEIRANLMRNKIVNQKLAEVGFSFTTSKSEIRSYFDYKTRTHVCYWEE